MAALCLFFRRRCKVVQIYSNRRLEPGSANPAMTSSSDRRNMQEVDPPSIYKTRVDQSHEVGGLWMPSTKQAQTMRLVK